MEIFEIITLKKDGVTDFASERNKLLSNSKSDWVFFVDPDEVTSKDLKNEIEEVIKDNSYDGFFVTRRDYMFGKELRYGEFSKYGWFGNSQLLRLGKRDAGRWERSVHETWKIDGKKGSLKNPLLHYPHKDLRTFIKNINYFSTLHAKALELEGKRSSLLKIIIWPVGKFVYNMVFRLGFLDGMEGFVVALIMSFHSFLSWSKLYFLRS